MKQLTKRALSLLLCLSLILAWIPAGAPRASGAETDNRVVDDATLNQWQEYFSATGLSTEFAGGVWTDKSVMTDASQFMADISMNDPANNFLIALSALAANQQIVGYATAPIDVMLVLDVSGSMQGTNATTMVQAANEALESLLKQNNNNRVGVVLYSGNSNTNQNAGTGTATVLLPLDRYTTSSTQTVGSGRDQTTIPAYLSISGNTVSVASTVKNGSSQSVTGSKNVSGGTYIQNGMYKAWEEFSKVTDVKVPAGQAQAGTQRTPVMVLLSDGQPTLATADYSQVDTSQRTYGNGQESSTSWKTVFLTQLTAAWVKGKMADKYGTAAKFYTLGLGTGSSNYATAVLNPSAATNTTLAGYWDNYFDADRLSANGNVRIDNSLSVRKESAVASKNYADAYHLAVDSDELLATFKKIVDSIELDAAGHVTLVEESGEDLSGYITFTDELGMFMEVKDLKGLVLGDTLFSGNAIAKALLDGSLGTIETPSELGNEFVATVQERLHIDDLSVAQRLIGAAYNDEQLYYNAQTGAYSNYIGWYSDDNGTYLGFWDKDTGITSEGAPDTATWINKSYGYLGVAGSSDMMHVVVMISTHIASGMQVIQYKIPASLIPKVTYEVELVGSDATQMQSITRKEAFPLRLVYEVGLQDGINAVTVEEKLNAAIEAGYGHAHKQTDGSYAFYTNLWGAEHGDTTVDYTDPLNHRVAESHFHPAVGNGRYYYTEDTLIYSDTQGTAYQGAVKPSGNGFYRAYHYYTAAGYTTKYIAIAAEALAVATRHTDGNWYVPAGTVFQQIDRFKMLKGGDANADGSADKNLTGTLEYFDYPVVVQTTDKYDVYAFLGNNGKITIQPAQGIRLTKTVSETVSGAEDSFTFDITLSQAVAAPAVTDTDGNALTGWSVNGNVITVTLKAGETVCITELPTGVTYTVTERTNADYVGSSQNATGTVAAGKMNAVDFVNVPRGYGNLIVSKDVDHPFTNVPQALSQKEFSITVTLTGEDVANQQFAIAGTDPAEYITTDANGSFTVKLKDNGSVTLVGLPEGTTFTATETLDPDAHKGFAMDQTRSVLEGTITKDATAQAHVVNVYAPASPQTKVQIGGSKILTDEAGAFDWTGKSFTIRLEQYDPATGAYTTLGEKQVTEGNLTYLFDDQIRFAALGSYYFKVSEVIPTDRLEGMSYDATVGRIEVVVTDENVDGVMELTVYDFDTNQPIAAVDGVVSYTKNFENIHTTDATFVEFTVEKNLVDPHNTGATEAGYLFELFEVIGGVAQTTPAYSMRTVLVGGQGQATFHIPITKVGTRTFLLKEIAPLDADKLPGMIYDSRTYTVTVTGESEGGKLVPKLTIQDASGTEVPPVFENVIDLQPAQLQPGVNKELIGRDPLSNTEFTFSITQTDGSFATAISGGYSSTVSVGEGSASFDSITLTQVGTYYYRVIEVAGNAGGMSYDPSIYHITVNVTAEGNALKKDVSIVKVGQGAVSSPVEQIIFTNTYRNTDTEEVTFQGGKTLTGRPLMSGEFRFQLKKGETVLQTVSNRADGSFVFAPIVYTASDLGLHTYTISEVNDGKGGVAYDDTVYTVTVLVEDNGQNDLSVTVTGADAIAFENEYTTQPTTVGFNGTKTWYSYDLEANKTLIGGEFTFGLYETDETFQTQGNQVATVTNASGGSFRFELDYTAAGHYYYLLRELEGSDPTVSYDASVYQVHIHVYDNGVGQLIGAVDSISQVGTGSSTVQFQNGYTPAGTEASISGTKQLDGRPLSDGEFRFSLLQNGETLQTVTNVGNRFTFDPIGYTKSGIYRYQVVEQIPEQAVNNVYHGVTYDATVFDVAVTVTDENGQLTASTAVTAAGSPAALEFVNRYNITNYTDFDLVGSKILYYGNDPIDMGGRTFRFAILDDNGVVVQTVSSNATGNFRFDNVPLTETGIHTFTVVELNDGLGGIRYDDTVYTVTVEVTDNGTGGLHAEDPVITRGGQNATLTFRNIYTLESTELALQVQKVLENKDLEAGKFQFVLYDADGNPLQTKTNTSTGEVFFDAIEYATYGTYTYTVKEQIPSGDKHGIAYDQRTVQITVTVTDNGDGTLTAVADYTNGSVFTNVYSVTGSPTFSLTGEKQLSGRDLESGEFTFVLEDSTGGKLTAVNDGKEFRFQNVPLAGLGIHTFTLYEKDTGKGGIVYDTTVYTVTVTVIDNGLGGMDVSDPVITKNGVAASAVFTNRYEPKSTDYTFTATKHYTKPLTDGLFTFTLTGEGEAQTKTNVGGTVTFDTLTFRKAGIYTYTVQESIGTKDYIDYDDMVYTVVIEVRDDLLGQLHIHSVNVNNGGNIPLVFSNTYKLNPTGLTINGTKELYAGGLTPGQFTFSLYETDSTYSIEGLTAIGSVSNGSDGSFSFSADTVEALNYSTEGTHYYVLAENTADPAEGIRYDTTLYRIQVTVTDDQEGQLVAEAVCVNGDVNALRFLNVPHEHIVQKDAFYPDTTVSIDGQKVTAGETLEYTISYRNFTNDALEVTITDTLPRYTAFVSASHNGTYTDGTVTWTLTVPAKESVTVSLRVTAEQANVVIANTATVVEGTNTYKTNTVVLHTVEEPLVKDVSIADAPTVSVDGTQVQVGDILTYSITYYNTTPEAVDVQLADKIPVHTTYVDSSATLGGTLEQGVLCWQITVAAWDSVTVTFQVEVNDLSATVENTAAAYDGTNTYTSNTTVNTTPDPVPDPTIPNTGDNTNLVLLVSAMGISGMGILVLLAVMRADKRKKEQ